MGKPRIISFYIPYKYKIEQPDTRQRNGIQNCEKKCGSTFIKIWKMLSLKTTLRVRSSGSASAEIIRTKGCDL